MKAAANGALAFVFDLAINAISSQIGTSIEKMMQKVQQFTQHSLDACQAGQQVAAGLAGMVGARDSQFCKIIGNSQGVFSTGPHPNRAAAPAAANPRPSRAIRTARSRLAPTITPGRC
jgi:hypothetical protein